MGAADIVPGVSGGTIAFITGIYFRLLEAINAVPGAVFHDLIRGRFSRFWHACDGTFLVALLAGVLTSIATLASGISYMLVAYPILIWSFFFGLIVASVWHVGRQVRHYKPALLVPLLFGIVIAWWITTLSASEVAPSTLAFFGAGALAICAMILPGISGQLYPGDYWYVCARARRDQIVGRGHSASVYGRLRGGSFIHRPPDHLGVPPFS